ncbi:MAG: hypothetical protein OXH84_07435 [Gammaproteobacteria bacterium]|nr:hypothetical protein [Gammaproteobacteria bacterium]
MFSPTNSLFGASSRSIDDTDKQLTSRYQRRGLLIRQLFVEQLAADLDEVLQESEAIKQERNKQANSRITAISFTTQGSKRYEQAHRPPSTIPTKS